MPDRPESSRPSDHASLRAVLVESAGALRRLAESLRTLEQTLELPPPEVLDHLLEAGTPPRLATVAGILGSVVVDHLEPAAEALESASRELD